MITNNCEQGSDIRVFADITFNRYGRLTVIKASHKSKEHRWVWLCKCDCGNFVFRTKNNLEYKGFKSCGCFIPKTNLSHGLKGSRIYRIWSGIKDRCTNKRGKSYDNYMGRGITMCDEWKASVEKFLADVGLPPTRHHQIDRIDNNKGYFKENCHWVLPEENACNRRNSKIWHIKGMLFYSATKAAEHFNVSDVTIHRWCKGGDRTIKKDDCYFKDRYPC